MIERNDRSRSPECAPGAVHPFLGYHDASPPRVRYDLVQPCPAFVQHQQQVFQDAELFQQVDLAC